MRIVDHAVELLVRKGRIKGEALALDSTFIKACSRRNLDNRTGYSDPESRVGSIGKREREETLNQPVWKGFISREA